MATARQENPFVGVTTFGWHDAKRDRNLQVHKIDFADVTGIFEGETFVRRSDRNGEIRYQVFGYIEGREVAVACAIRVNVCWIISARRARRDERRKFYDRLANPHPPRSD